MGKRGRQPKPTSLKILESVRGDRINVDEPRFDAVTGMPIAPAGLKGLARECWDQLAPVLIRGRVFTEGDHQSLALLCELYARWRADIHDNQAIEKYIRMACEFGLTPSARSRLKAMPEKPADELAAFLDAKKA